MRRNARTLLIAFTLSVSGVGCFKDSVSPLSPETKDIGPFYLLPESIAQMPYAGKGDAIYVDSIGNTMRLEVTEHPLTGPDVYSKTVRNGQSYAWQSQSKTVILSNTEADLRFIVQIRAEPYQRDLECGCFADVLKVLSADQGSTIFWLSFSDILHIRTWPVDEKTEPVNLGPLNIYGKHFDEVLYSPGSYVVYFNYTDGIIQFRDHGGTLWRFERFDR